MSTTRMQSFTCPGCDAALGNMPADGSSLQIGSVTIIRDIELVCNHCGRATTWHAPRPAVVSRRTRRPKKHAAPLGLLVELAA
jgi:hypothetical protein